MRAKSLYVLLLMVVVALFTVQPADATHGPSGTLGQVTAQQAYDAMRADPEAIAIDVRTVDEHNGCARPWLSSSCPEGDVSAQGTMTWTVNGIRRLPINVPYWNTANSGTGAPEEWAEVRAIFGGLLESGAIDYDTPIYLFCRSGYRSYYMGNWMLGTNFDPVTGASGTTLAQSFTNLHNIGIGSPPSDGSMLDWIATGLPIYSSTATSGAGVYYMPPTVVSTTPIDNYMENGTSGPVNVNFLARVLEPTPGGVNFNHQTVNTVTLKVDGAITSNNTTDTSGSGGPWYDYSFTSIPVSAGTHTWNVLSKNTYDGGWNAHILDGPEGIPGGPAAKDLEVQVITAPVLQYSSPSATSTAVSGGTGVIIDVRTWEEHNGCFVTGWGPFSYGSCGTYNSPFSSDDERNARSPEWTVGGVVRQALLTPFRVSSDPTNASPENAAEFRASFEHFLKAGLINCDTPLYMLCRSGWRSYMAGQWLLSNMCFTNVYNIDADTDYTNGGATGGMIRWSNDGLAAHTGFHGAMIYAIGPDDSYTNYYEDGTSNATGVFKAAVHEPARSQDPGFRNYGCTENIQLTVDGSTYGSAVNYDTDPNSNLDLWTVYRFEVDPLSTASHTWEVSADNGWGASAYVCPITSAIDTMWTDYSEASGGPGQRSMTSNPGTCINVSDSVSGQGDKELRYGDISSSTTLDRTVTITNCGSGVLSIGTIPGGSVTAAQLVPFSIVSTTCSGGLSSGVIAASTLASGASCNFVFRFSPTVAGAFGKKLRIDSDDPDDLQVVLSTCGTSDGTAWPWPSSIDSNDDIVGPMSSSCLSEVASNHHPSPPELVYPEDGETGLGSTVIFEWNPSTDEDGDDIGYEFYLCAGEDCDVGVASAVISPITRYAGIGYGAGLLLFGIVLASGVSRRRRIALLIGMLILTGMFLVSCGTSGTGSTAGSSGDLSYLADDLESGSTYSWKVLAVDSEGKGTWSETRTFSTQ